MICPTCEGEGLVCDNCCAMSLCETCDGNGSVLSPSEMKQRIEDLEQRMIKLELLVSS